MVRYKNIARDFSSSPLQLRTWVTDGYPDLDGSNYTGPISGDLLVDFSSYIICDDNAIVDFNFPLATKWDKAYEVLPETMESSSLAVIGEYIYLFGGRVHNKILRARTADPARWEDTGATLPDNLYGSHLLVSGDYIYLIGGNNGVAVMNIYSAPKADPLTWTDHGPLLPEPRQFGQLVVLESALYLLGGRDTNSAQNTIWTASPSDPLTWTDTGDTLPQALYGSQVTVSGGYISLLGGSFEVDVATDRIYRAPIGTPTTFTDDGYLPYECTMGQVIAIGDDLYYYTATGPAEASDGYTMSNTRILTADKNLPLIWTDTGETIPAQIDMSQMAIIYDRIFSFGGSGSAAIFASDPFYKYPYDAILAIKYGLITRTNYDDAANERELFGILSYPNWKANYGEI